MKGTIASVFKAIEAFHVKVGQIASLGVLLLIAIVVYDVTARYIFNAPTIWAFKLTSFLAGGIYILGGAYVLQQNRHVVIDILSSKLPQRARIILNLVLYFLFFFPFTFLLLKGTIDQAIWSWQVKEREFETVFRAPLYPIKIVIAIAIVMLFIQGMISFIKEAQGLKKDEK